MDSTISTDFMILRYWTWISIAINPFVSMIRLDAIKSSWRIIFRYLISFRARRKKKKKEKEWNFSSNEIRPESRTTIREGEKKKKKEEEKQRSGDKVPIYKEDSYWKGVRWPSVCVEDFKRNSQGQYKHTQVFGDWVHQPVTCTVAIPQRNPLPPPPPPPPPL